MMKPLILALAFLLGPALNTQAAEKTVVTIGFNPAENADVVEANGKLFGEFYKKQTGLDVKTFVATDYTALIEALRSGRIDFAFLPPFSFVKAEEVADAKVLMKAVRNGSSVLYSAIIVRADKGYDRVEDLKGKNIAWVDPSSASGFIVPKAALVTKKKLDPDKFFRKQIYAGSHDALVLAVLNGTVDAGATYVNDPHGKDGAWHQFLKDPVEQKKIKMIFVSDPMPTDTMATSGKFFREHRDIVEKTTKLLAEMGKNPEGKKILTVLYRIDSMIPASPKEYQFLREAAKILHLD